MGGILSEAQVQRYREDGYLFPFDVLTPPEAQQDLARLEAIEAANGGRLPPRLNQRPHLLFPFLADLVRHPRQSQAYDAHDVGRTPGFDGDWRAAPAAIRARVLVIAPPLDLCNPAHSARDAARNIAGCRFVELDTDWGHQSASEASPAAAEISGTISTFLSS